MDAGAVTDLRRALVLCTLDARSRTEQIRLKGDTAKLDAAVVQWEQEHARPLEELFKIVDRALLELTFENTKPETVFSMARIHCARQALTMPSFGFITGTITPLRNLFEYETRSANDVIDTLRRVWIAIGGHDELLQIYASSFQGDREADAPKTNGAFLAETRQWTAQAYDVLCEIWRIASAVDTRRLVAGHNDARTLLLHMVSELSDEALAEMHRVPGLRITEVPSQDNAFTFMFARLARVLPR